MKKVKAAIVLLTYFLLVVTPSTIHADCCTDRHDDLIQVASSSELHPQEASDRHLLNDGVQVEPALTVAAAHESSTVGAAAQCPGHQCDRCGLDLNNQVLTTSNSSKSRDSEYSPSKAFDAIDCLTVFGNPLPTRVGPANIQTITSLQTIVLLI